MSRILQYLVCTVALSGVAALSQQVVITANHNPASGSTPVTFTISGDCPNDTQHTYRYTYQWYYTPQNANNWQMFGQSNAVGSITWSHPYTVPGTYLIKAQVPEGYAVCPNFAAGYTLTLTK